ncbi:MAG TPA: SAM-dependent methyltransferase [Thermoplasmata archaeon]|nr:SAM-dependent methyltransferase [Thermoplasmata archaeon]
MAERSPGDPANSPDAEPVRRITSLLRQHADPSGWLRFDRFMDLALYTEGAGFYTRPDVRLGRAGAFYTAAHTTPLFGATLAKRAAEEFRALGRPANFQVVEVGAGDGTLFTDFMAAARRDPDLGEARWTYRLVERSPALTGRLRERTASTDRPTGVSVEPASTVSEVGPFQGLLFGNELLDAFPVRRFTRVGGELVELGVQVGAPRLDWASRPVTDAPAGVPPVPALGEDEVFEVTPRAEAFLREIADLLLEGTAIFLDYGDSESELRHRFPRGSLSAIRGHRVVDDALEHLGETDLSANVNFTRMRSAAARAGLHEIAYESQSSALGRWGFAEARDEWLRTAKDPETSVRRALGAKNLLFGFSSFRVLELGAGAGGATRPKTSGPRDG